MFYRLASSEKWPLVFAVAEVVCYNMLQGGLETYGSISWQLFPCASPQRAGMKRALVAVWY